MGPLIKIKCDMNKSFFLKWLTSVDISFKVFELRHSPDAGKQFWRIWVNIPEIHKERFILPSQIQAKLIWGHNI